MDIEGSSKEVGNGKYWPGERGERNRKGQIGYAALEVKLITAVPVVAVDDDDNDTVFGFKCSISNQPIHL